MSMIDYDGTGSEVELWSDMLERIKREEKAKRIAEEREKKLGSLLKPWWKIW